MCRGVARLCGLGIQLGPIVREGCCFILQLRVPVLGLIDAARLLREWIAGDGIGAGARAAADFLVLAGAALAFELAGVAQRLEDGRIAVDLTQWSLTDAAWLWMGRNPLG